MAVAQHRRMLAKLLVETLEFALGLVAASGHARQRSLLLVFDALAVIEHRLQRRSVRHALHVMLSNLASVCSYELAS